MTLAALLREWSSVCPCLLAACALVTAGCDPGADECSCRAPGITLQICPGLVDQVQEVELSGPACSGASKRILDASAEGGAGMTYVIKPAQTGGCSIEVLFKNGLTFSQGSSSTPLTITQGPGCCTGLYPDPLSAGEIQVCPEADGGADAETIRDGANGS